MHEIEVLNDFFGIKGKKLSYAQLEEKYWLKKEQVHLIVNKVVDETESLIRTYKRLQKEARVRKY